MLYLLSPETVFGAIAFFVIALAVRSLKLKVSIVFTILISATAIVFVVWQKKSFEEIALSFLALGGLLLLCIGLYGGAFAVAQDCRKRPDLQISPYVLTFIFALLISEVMAISLDGSPNDENFPQYVAPLTRAKTSINALCFILSLMWTGIYVETRRLKMNANINSEEQIKTL